MKGKVKFFSKEKGFGFVVADDGTEHFLGVREVIGAELPNNGDIVEFESRNGKKGPIAAQLKILRSSENFNQRNNERVSCSTCGKMIIPRIITGPPVVRPQHGWTPVPKKSICPFCAATHQDFPMSNEESGLAIIYGILILFVFLSIVLF